VRKSSLIAFAIFIATQAQAQTTDETIPTKRFTHQLGVQANELIRQVFNFNNGSSNVNNPYLLVYHFNSVRSGLGVRVGVGYNYQDFVNDDGVTRRETNLNDMQARLGFEKMFRLSSHWTAGVGIDGVYNLADDYTKNTIRSFDTTTTITKSKVSSYGGGPMAWLRYQVGSRILIGTETSFYYTTGNQKDDIFITKRQFSGGGNNLVTTTTTVDNDRSEGKFSVPVAFYLIVQF
jgi:hypothetical protein